MLREFGTAYQFTIFRAYMFPFQVESDKLSSARAISPNIEEF
jgi:hypothetical protein